MKDTVIYIATFVVFPLILMLGSLFGVFWLKISTLRKIQWRRTLLIVLMVFPLQLLAMYIANEIIYTDELPSNTPPMLGFILLIVYTAVGIIFGAVATGVTVYHKASKEVAGDS